MREKTIGPAAIGAALPAAPGAHAPTTSYDLLLLFSVALLLPILTAFPIVPLLRVPLGLIGVLIAPGYAIIAALLPRRSDLDGPARAGLTIGLSLASIPLIALLLDRLPWGLRPLPIALSLSAWIIFWTVAALLLRIYSPSPTATVATHPTRLDLLAIGAFVLLAALIVVATFSSIDKQPPFTEFYALGDEGLAEGYPREVLVDQPVALTLGLVNRESGPLRYRAEARVDAALVGALAPIELAPGASWEGPFSLRMPEPGADQRVEILLFVEGRAEPYRRLTLWLNVRATPAPTG